MHEFFQHNSFRLRFLLVCLKKVLLITNFQINTSDIRRVYRNFELRKNLIICYYYLVIWVYGRFLLLKLFTILARI